MGGRGQAGARVMEYVGGFTNQNVRYIMDIKWAITDVLCPINIGHKITPNKLKDIFS